MFLLLSIMTLYNHHIKESINIHSLQKQTQNNRYNFQLDSKKLKVFGNRPDQVIWGQNL